jgi:hypothetical protein
MRSSDRSQSVCGADDVRGGVLHNNIVGLGIYAVTSESVAEHQGQYLRAVVYIYAKLPKKPGRLPDGKKPIW